MTFRRPTGRLSGMESNGFDVSVLMPRRRIEIGGPVMLFLKSRTFRIRLALVGGYVLLWYVLLIPVIVKAYYRGTSTSSLAGAVLLVPVQWAIRLSPSPIDRYIARYASSLSDVEWQPLVQPPLPVRTNPPNAPRPFIQPNYEPEHLAEYRTTVELRDTAKTDRERLIYAGRMKVLQQSWTRLTGNDDLHEKAFGKPAH